MSDLFPSDFDETPDQVNALLKNNNVFDFKTSLNFLLAHNGMRKNKMHLLIAPTSAGKSTLTRTIVYDFIKNNPDKKILIWLTEESKDEFKTAFYKMDTSKLNLQNIKISSQIGIKANEKSIKYQIEEMIDHYDIDLVLCDNITTAGEIYRDKNVETQSNTAAWLKDLVQKTTIFVIAHTNTKEFTDRLLDSNDIRGSKTIVNLTEFMYIMQPININNSLHQFLLIKKHRGQELNSRFFQLIYESKTQSFSKDIVADFKGLVELFRLRNKL